MHNTIVTSPFLKKFFTSCCSFYISYRSCSSFRSTIPSVCDDGLRSISIGTTSTNSDSSRNPDTTFWFISRSYAFPCATRQTKGYCISFASFWTTCLQIDMLFHYTDIIHIYFVSSGTGLWFCHYKSSHLWLWHFWVVTIFIVIEHIINLGETTKVMFQTISL